MPTIRPQSATDRLSAGIDHIKSADMVLQHGPATSIGDIRPDRDDVG